MPEFDTSVIEDLVETLEDGKKGFGEAAEKLREDGHTQLAEQMREFSDQRARLSNELREMARSAGENEALRGAGSWENMTRAAHGHHRSRCRRQRQPWSIPSTDPPNTHSA